MAFPSDIGTKADDLARVWMWARGRSGAVKKAAENLRTLAAAGTASASNLLDFATFLADARVDLVKYSGIPGIEAYAQQQINDPTLDLDNAFSTMIAAMDGCRDWIVANFPKEGNGYLLAQTILANGRQQDRVFSSAQTTGLQSALTVLIATID